MNKARVLMIILLSLGPLGSESYSRQGNSLVETAAPVHHYWGDVDGFLNRQAEVSLDLVRMALKRFPPTFPEPFERRMALLMIDGVLHDPDAPQRSAIQNFFHSRIELVLKGLSENRVEKGAMIWKLYNHGFIVRTPTVTFAFDLVTGRSSGAADFPIPGTLVQQIARHCDALFVSHRHVLRLGRFVVRFASSGRRTLAQNVNPVEQGNQHWLGVL